MEQHLLHMTAAALDSTYQHVCHKKYLFPQSEANTSLPIQVELSFEVGYVAYHTYSRKWFLTHSEYETDISKT